ncbi:MBL fold metallo-hydrolase [Marinithermus hydrothermalis]|uniref:Beta-lactamase domain protein n=1 Tax=Marinithermus hydrothermalis (strain DSM 14884 / JCM 11576 / T1) TaxID=869210 RepID=F2NQK6_MARHT|nr:MBL fold metallo-hydrolase [Marinithermus hydrothermalis]AEB11944.1 beta-lactamase domain protein [Marinithermus hydrothermalis DSM 14884]
MQRYRLGNLEVFFLQDGAFRLDGGAMFGVVPKVLWSKVAPPDEANRIPLTLRPMLVRVGEKWVLVETGVDDKPGEKHRRIYAIDRSTNLLAALKALGLTPEDIDLVVNTHLHFDHAGLNTVRDEAGRIVPLFRRARYVVQRQELYDALHPHERSRASYLPENIEPVLEAGLFEEVEGEAELLPGVRVVPLPGHTLGQQGVVLESEGQRLVYTADLLPTFAHAPLPYIMAYDLYPVTTLETRKRFYPVWAEEGYLVAPPHDPTYALGRLVLGERGYTLVPV